MRRLPVLAAAVVATFALAPVAHSATVAKTPDEGGKAWSSALEGRVSAQGVDLVAPNTARISGADRYETAVELSKFVWEPETTWIVFLATGESFPDALAAGASTVGTGPILLTSRTSLPPVVADELARLRPCVVIALGGPNAVSDQVLAQADTYTLGFDAPECSDSALTP